MKGRIMCLAVALVLAVTWCAPEVSAGEVPHVFTPNTVAKSSEINENFQALAGMVVDKSSLGYVRIGSLQIAWGTASVNLGESDTASISFPVNFATAPTLSTTCSYVESGSAAVKNTPGMVGITGLTQSSFQVSGVPDPGISITVKKITWVAIGPWK
ncbi:MAG: hypothetical protein AB1916_01985 [Thermodesulfobacteriota bacterium]